MKHTYLLPAFSLLGLLSGCSKNPVQEFRLSTEQLAWQPYRTGNVLRFGQASSGKVRTFIIDEVEDKLKEYSIGGNAPVFFGSPKRVKSQSIEVLVRRTDTIRYTPTPTSTPTRPDSIPDTYARSLLSMSAGDNFDVGYAYLNWDFGFSNSLPIDEVIAGRPLMNSAQLLPTLRLGGINYESVLRIPNGLSGNPSGFPRNKPARFVYYAKGFGVVGFEEGNTLWYRLP
ncbi:hypothetical protein [Hymenobacter sp. BT190]|uniref:hypothetical protein n=1 Tax=Hymenobacter sp. BT190 TaxID=2763505 RepID=UPI001650FC68|nr:hypothetical protein [Hymenobacter sp. BT190]MBC6696512.1 hypothetical protein [Hymenobacter sp. BT190]